MRLQKEKLGAYEGGKMLDVTRIKPGMQAIPGMQSTDARSGRREYQSMLRWSEPKIGTVKIF